MRYLLFLAFLFFLAVPAAATELNITLANNSEREQATAELLQRLADDMIPERWIFTKDILINENDFPHSHPVLTLHARYFNDPDRLLSAFLHEQFHWYEEANPEKIAIAVEELKKAYPEVPTGRPLGGRDAYSTYIHMVVCDLEYEATAFLIGAEKTREIINTYRIYQWIYPKAMDRDPALMKALEKAEISLP